MATSRTMVSATARARRMKAVAVLLLSLHRTLNEMMFPTIPSAHKLPPTTVYTPKSNAAQFCEMLYLSLSPVELPFSHEIIAQNFLEIHWFRLVIANIPEETGNKATSGCFWNFPFTERVQSLHFLFVVNACELRIPSQDLLICSLVERCQMQTRSVKA